MRIDYSEPKQAYVTAQNKKQPRKEPAGMITTIVIATGIITFLVGFGTGWFFSQRSAKKAFQAATEQTSLENSPRQPATPPAGAQPAAPPQTSTTNPETAPGTQAAPDSPLSFYKTLPSGQKNNVIGSGINANDDKARQPLQAAIPSNLTKPPQTGTDTAKPSAPTPQASADKRTAKQDSNAFTVQVASYSLKSEAETLKSKLASKGYNVSIIESNQGDKGTWYRVRVGKKLDQEAAKELASKLGKGAIPIPDHE